MISLRKTFLRRRPIGRVGTRVLWGAFALLGACAAFDWLSVETKRIYADELPEGAVSGVAEQQFNIRGKYVRPEIVAVDAARFVVPLELNAPHHLVFGVRGNEASTYEVAVRRAGRRELLETGSGSTGATQKFSVPVDAEQLEFVSTGRVVWRDIRLARSFFLWPVYLAAGVVFIVVLALVRPARLRRTGEVLTLCASVVLCLVAAEWLLRSFASRLPPVILAARHEIGVVGTDPRWIDADRYKLRLRPNIDTYSEWRHGGIVRLGFLPKELSPDRTYRYRVRTDAEGFRNERVRDKIDVAALGDSFTDATSGPVEESWPARLEQLSGLTVQNYGTSGFGPQQELYVLRDYVLKRKPRWVVLAFYAGNDLHDAEAFDEWERAGRRVRSSAEGWKLAESLRRYETLYLWTVGRVGAHLVAGILGLELGRASNAAGLGPAEAHRFDRGMFTIRHAGSIMQFSFLAPYLQQLGSSRESIERRRGWELTRETLRQIREECAGHGASFVLMFVPEKAQVYWPLAERYFSTPELQQALDFYSRLSHGPIRVEDVRKHRLAQNELLRDFCAAEGIPMLDLTEPLQHAVAAGRQVYFADDPHWNAAGHDIAARQLEVFLRVDQHAGAPETK